MNTQLNIFTVHANSLEVYRKKVEPTLSGRKLQVLEAIRALGGSATMYEIGKFLNKPLNTFSGRLGELKKMGLIEDSGQRKKHHDNNFTIWRIVNK